MSAAYLMVEAWAMAWAQLWLGFAQRTRARAEADYRGLPR